MKKRFYIIFIAFLMLICFVYNIIVGSRYIIETDINGYNGTADKLTVTVHQDKEILKVTEYHIQNEKLYITVESISSGRAFLSGAVGFDVTIRCPAGRRLAEVCSGAAAEQSAG